VKRLWLMAPVAVLALVLVSSIPAAKVRAAFHARGIV
jgi:hypothetical protein